MTEHGVCASISSGLYRHSVWPFLTRDFLAGPLLGGAIRYALSEDWYPTVEGDGFLGDTAGAGVRHPEACSTDPSEARRASSSVAWSSPGCRDANRASLNSVDSSSRDALLGSGSTRLLFRDTNASMVHMQAGAAKGAHSVEKGAARMQSGGGHGFEMESTTRLHVTFPTARPTMLCLGRPRRSCRNHAAQPRQLHLSASNDAS